MDVVSLLCLIKYRSKPVIDKVRKVSDKERLTKFLFFIFGLIKIIIWPPGFKSKISVVIRKCT